jgi:hypothetical protein
VTVDVTVVEIGMIEESKENQDLNPMIFVLIVEIQDIGNNFII